MVWWLLNRYILTDTSLLILFVLTASIFLLVWLRTRLGGRRAVEPQCGACGYCVRGISSLTCPECGNNLAQVGIIVRTGHPPRPLGPLGVAVLWSVALPIPALLVSANLVRTIVPGVHTQSLGWVINNYDKSGRSSVFFLDWLKQDHIYGLGTGATGTALVHQIEVSTDLAPSCWMRVNLLHRTYDYTEASGKTMHGQGHTMEEALRGWLTACRVSPSQLSDRAIKDLLQTICCPEAFLPNVGPKHIVTPAQWAVVLLVALWLLVWLAGLVWIWHRHQARTAPPSGNHVLQEQAST